MLKVERKHVGRRPRGRSLTVILVLCLLALSVTAAVLMRRHAQEEEPAPVRQDTGGTLFLNEPEDILRVTVCLKGLESWTMERSGEGAFRLEGEEDPVDPVMADRVTGALACLEYTDIFTEEEADYLDRLSEFGLDNPQVTVTWTLKNGESRRLRIGDAVEPEEADCCFMLVDGDANLYGADMGTLQDLAVERALLHAVPELPVRKALLDRITVRDASGEITAEWALAGRVTDQDAGVSWRITQPFEYAADEEMMENLRTCAGNLLLGSYAGGASESVLRDCGLEEPAGFLELHMAAGSTGTVTESGVYDVTDWEEETVALTLGAPAGGTADYVLYDGAVYTMTHFSLSPFTETDPMDTAARYPALTPLDSLTSLTVEKSGGQEDVYEIVRDRSEEEGEILRCLKNGEEIPYDAFEAAYSRLLVVTVSGTLPRNAEWEEAHTKYTFRTVSGGTHTVVLSNYDGMHDAVTLDGQTLFYLIRNGMTELP